MIKSMTGFGRAESVTPERKITVELKSVNHRYLDLSIKMPRKFSFLEAAVRNLMKTYMQRGKVDIYISCEDYMLNNTALKYNRELAKEMTDKCLARSDAPYISYCMACRDRFARQGRESRHILELVYGTDAG